MAQGRIPHADFLKAAQDILRGQSRPPEAEWQSMFSIGMVYGRSLDEHLFEFGRNVGRFCSIGHPAWQHLDRDCCDIVESLRDAKGMTERAAARLIEYHDRLPADRRGSPRVSVHCDITVQENLRCQVFPEFGEAGGVSGFTDAAPFETPHSYFLHVKGLRRVLGCGVEDLQPIIGDIASLIVIRFEECLGILRAHFEVAVASAPAIRLGVSGTNPAKKVNLGLIVEPPSETAARHAEISRQDEIEKSVDLLARFVRTFPDGTPEQFVRLVEDAPAKSSRASVIRELGRFGYVSAKPSLRLELHPSSLGYSARFHFDNRNLMWKAEALAKALDREKPGWREAPVPPPTARAPRQGSRSRR